jgi:hypothetical protein
LKRSRNPKNQYEIKRRLNRMLYEDEKLHNKSQLSDQQESLNVYGVKLENKALRGPKQVVASTPPAKLLMVQPLLPRLHKKH